MSLINSTRNLFELLLFVTLIILFFALMGYRILGDVSIEGIEDFETVNFKEIPYSMSALYFLISTDNYPDILLPAVHESYYYMFFFVPYMLISIFIVAPIPVAILFSAYKM